MILLQWLTSKPIRFVSEESKVKLKGRVSSLGDLKKRGANRIAFFAFGFSKSKPLLSPAKARCFAGSGVHRHESGRGRPNRRCHRDLCLSQLNVRPAAAPPP